MLEIIFFGEWAELFSLVTWDSKEKTRVIASIQKHKGSVSQLANADNPNTNPTDPWHFFSIYQALSHKLHCLISH